MGGQGSAQALAARRVLAPADARWRSAGGRHRGCCKLCSRCSVQQLRWRAGMGSSSSRGCSHAAAADAVVGSGSFCAATSALQHSKTHRPRSGSPLCPQPKPTASTLLHPSPSLPPPGERVPSGPPQGPGSGDSDPHHQALRGRQPQGAPPRDLQAPRRRAAAGAARRDGRGRGGGDAALKRGAAARVSRFFGFWAASCHGASRRPRGAAGGPSPAND